MILVGNDGTLGETLDEIAQRLSQRGHEVARLTALPPPAITHIDLARYAAVLREAEIIIVSSRTLVDAQVMEAAPKLKAVIFPSIGMNSCDLQAAKCRGIQVLNGATEENYESMAESVVMLMAALSLQLPQKQNWLREGQANPPPSRLASRMLRGSTIGLIGYGRIAEESVQRLQGWGIKRFLVHTRSPRDNMQNLKFCDLQYLLKESDLISIHCPLTPETRNLLSVEEFAQMKDGVVIINTARGGIIDEDALCQALDSGKVSAAAIDTFAVEPLPASHSLRERENVILTQHNVGHTRELFESLPQRAIHNVEAVLHAS